MSLAKTITCAGCGATLKVEGIVTAVKCAYCGATNEFENPLIGDLGDNGVMILSGLEINAKSLEERIQEESAGDVVEGPDGQVVEVVRAGGLTQEDFQELLRDFDSELREALAGNPGLPPAVALELGREGNREVRIGPVHDDAADHPVRRDARRAVILFLAAVGALTLLLAAVVGVGALLYVLFSAA